ncbi:MAG: single-stranded DNA-binding protein [Spirochaetota bacterium]
MNELNKVILIGRMTRDPEYKIINQTGVVNFSVANNRSYVSNNEKKEEAHFFDCEAWGKMADTLKQYASKGTKLAIEGRLKQSTWDTPDGKKASKIRIHVESFQFLGGGAGNQQQNQYQQQPYQDNNSYQTAPQTQSYPDNNGGYYPPQQQQPSYSAKPQQYNQPAPPPPGNPMEEDEDDIF